MQQPFGHETQKRKSRSIGVIVVLFGLAALIFARFFDGGSDMRVDAAESKTSRCTLNCEECGESMTVSGAEYLSITKKLSGNSKMDCPKCGKAAMWNAPPRVELTNKEWNNGHAGRDVLVSELREYHRQHPEQD